jgi:hypothetical protein
MRHQVPNSPLVGVLFRICATTHTLNRNLSSYFFCSRGTVIVDAYIHCLGIGANRILTWMEPDAPWMPGHAGNLRFAGNTENVLLWWPEKLSDLAFTQGGH